MLIVMCMCTKGSLLCVFQNQFNFSLIEIDWNIHDNLLNKILVSCSVYYCILTPKSILKVSQVPQISYIHLLKNHCWDFYESVLCRDIKKKRKEGQELDPLCVMCLPYRCEDLTLDPKNPHKARNGSHICDPSASTVRWKAEIKVSPEALEQARWVFAVVSNCRCSFKLDGRQGPTLDRHTYPMHMREEHLIKIEKVTNIIVQII